MPDWNCTLPSGLMMNRPSKPIEPPENALTATPTPRTLVPTALAAARLLLVPLEQLGALVERFLDERARHVRLLAVAGSAGTERRLAGRRVDPADLDLIDAELACAAFARIGSMMPMPCMPPGARCEVFGGVLVSTVIDAPPHRLRLIARARSCVPAEPASPCASYGPLSQIANTSIASDAAVLAEADLHARVNARAARGRCSALLRA